MLNSSDENIQLNYGDIKVIGKHKPKPDIGKFVSIASGVTWIAVSHKINQMSTYPPHLLGIKNQDHHKYFKTLEIGNDVYIGNDVTFIGDIYIHNGAVIGAKSVVRHNVMPYSVVAGNPAVEIKKRIDFTDIDDMQAIAWWNWPLEEIKEQAHLIWGTDFMSLWNYALKTGRV